MDHLQFKVIVDDSNDVRDFVHECLRDTIEIQFDEELSSITFSASGSGQSITLPARYILNRNNINGTTLNIGSNWMVDNQPLIIFAGRVIDPRPTHMRFFYYQMLHPIADHELEIEQDILTDNGLWIL